MDVGSSNGSSVTSLDLNYDAEDAIERPLSPVLSTSKMNKRLLRNQKINRQSSKVKLANKFNDDVYSTVQNEIRNQYKNTTISHMTAVNVYEEQRKLYYDLLCDDGVENIYKHSHSVPTPTNCNSTPESSSQAIRNVMNDDGIETCVNYHYNENLKSVNFRTAGGRNIDLSDESLHKSSALFDDLINFEDKVSDPSVGYNTIFKRPGDVKKKLSKIPVLNQTKNTYRKTKATHSTYEQFKINMSDMTLTQTHVDTMEEFVDSNDTSNDFIMNEADSSGTLHENLYGDSMNKIFSNKKFVEFSSSSVENTTYSDTIVESGDIFAKHAKSKSKEKSNILLSSDNADIINEDWTDMQHIKSVPKQKSDSRSHTKTMETIQEQVPKRSCGQKFNLTPSKNVVLVSLPPNVNEGFSPNRNVVELHRNSNFAHSNDSVQHVDLIPEHDVDQKKKHVKKNLSDGFSGFTPEEHQHSKRIFAKVCEVVKRSEQALDEVKLKKTEKKHLKEKKPRRLKNHVDKCSLNSTPKAVIDDFKSNRRDKSKHRNAKTKDTDSSKESRYASSRKNKPRNTSVTPNVTPEPINKQSDNVAEGILNQDATKLVTYDQLSLIAQEACKKMNKKRKETPNVAAEPCTDQIVSDDTKKTIEVSPNQKKFKIQIDCNSKFRINISCNSENEDNKNCLEPVVEIHDQKAIQEARCEKEEPGDKNNFPEIDVATGQEPKGKYLQKFMNKTHKLYRDIKKPSVFDPESKDTFDENSRIPEKITKRSRRPSEGINTGSEPNYEDSQEMSLKPDYADFCGLKVMAAPQPSDETLKMSKVLIRESYEDKNVEMKHGFKTAGGKDLKISKKALDNAKKMYDSLHDKSEDAFEKREYPPISSIRDMEKNLNKAKKLFENFHNTNETSPKRDHLSKEEKAERVLNKMRKLYESLKNEDSLDDFTESIVEIENLQNLVSETVNDTETYLDTDEIYRDSDEKKPTSIQAFSSTGFVSASGKDVKTSDNAMAKARKMYAHASKDAEEDLKGNSNNSSGPGFKTASGKGFQVSEEALTKARKIYEQISDEKEDLNTETSSVTKSGFRRSLGKDFGFPHSEKPSKLHDTISEETSDFLPGANMGFMSASGKNVKISEKSLKRARKMYENIEKESDELDQKLRSPVEDPTRAKNVQHHVKSAPGANTANTTQKVKAIFDELSHQAGDFESSSKSEENPEKVGHDNIPQELRCHNPNPSSLCMGDYIQSNDSLIHESTSYPEHKHRKRLSPAVKNKVSKKAFELLEDVVDTVDHALHTIDERLKRPRLSISRRRLGVSRHKQVNISSEKLERAKLLFKDDFNESVKNIRNISTPVKIIKPTYSSTPILNKVNSTSVMASAAISPVKNRRSPPRRNTAKNVFQSSVVLQEQTKGNIADWSKNIDQEMEMMRLQIKIFEERKGYLVYQKEALENNKNVNISPQAGVLIRRKEHVKLHLNDLRARTSSDGISEYILDITPKNADLVHFNFEKSNNDLLHAYTSLDGALIIPNTKNLIGLTEVEVAFKIMPGVDLKLIPPGWIHHHYKLIVWKLASYERFLSIHLKGCLNIENVVQQLKYRYDREIDKAERPALRKILEKDDIPQKRLILCVSDIKDTETDKKELELCDGWYCLKTIIDDALTTQIVKGKVTVGTKLITSGAQIINCDGCHPLEVPDFVRLKISCNSTRRAPWFAKLGYQKQAGPLLVPLSSIKPDGGMIGCVKLYVARIYPLRFMEQIEDAKIWRNNKAEEKRAREFENDRLNKMEKVHYDVQKQYEREKHLERKNKALDCSKLSSSEILNIHCPKVLLGLLESSNDPDSVMEHMSSSQRGKVLDYRQSVCVERQMDVTRKIAEAMEKLKLAKRKVVSILKLLVVDATSDSDKAYQFCVWNPTEDDLSMLREYNVYLVYNILPRFNGELFSSNKTFFKSDRKMSYNKFKRQIYPIAMLRDKNYHPSFNEFDTVGIVVHVDIMESEQSLWVADTTANLLFVKVKDGPKFCRLLDDIMKGDVVSILNVIYSQPHADYAVAYANQFTIVTKSMQNYLRESIDMFKMQLPKDLTKFLNNCIANVEKFPRNTEPKTEKFDTAYMQCGLKLTPSLKAVVDDSSEEGSLIPESLTATDIAMSLIDTDKLM